MPNAIEVRGLVKAYDRLRAVDGIDFTVGPGEVFSFLGPNGAGKTTTVEILEGLRRATSGEVRVLGLDPWTEGRRLQRRIGVIPQDFHFFPTITPREAIELYAGLFEVPARPREILEQVELADKAEARYKTLSGGQHQKLGLALALTNDPELYFLDEPTTGLDPQARRAIWKVIEELRRRGRTVFLTTHYLEEAEQLSDRIAIIDHGRVIADGRPEDIIARAGRGERLRLPNDPPLVAFLRDELHLPVETNGHHLDVPIAAPAEGVDLLERIEQHGLPCGSFSTVTDTLEEVFIRLVGHLDDGAVRAGRAGARP